MIIELADDANRRPRRRLKRHGNEYDFVWACYSNLEKLTNMFGSIENN